MSSKMVNKNSDIRNSYFAASLWEKFSISSWLTMMFVIGCIRCPLRFYKFPSTSWLLTFFCHEHVCLKCFVTVAMGCMCVYTSIDVTTYHFSFFNLLKWWIALIVFFLIFIILDYIFSKLTSYKWNYIAYILFFLP